MTKNKSNNLYLYGENDGYDGKVPIDEFDDITEEDNIEFEEDNLDIDNDDYDLNF